MRSFALVLLAIAAVNAPYQARAATHRRSGERNAAGLARRRELRRSFGKAAVAQSAAGAGIRHLRHSPPEWGGGVRGYARRFGSGFGQHALKSGLKFGVGTLRREDPRSTRPLKPKGVRPKLKDALRNTFTVRRYGHQKRSIAAGNVAGNMGAGMLSRLWQPSNLATAGAGLQSGGISLGANLAINTAREFIPDRRKHAARKRRSRSHG